MNTQFSSFLSQKIENYEGDKLSAKSKMQQDKKQNSLNEHSP